MSLFVLAHRDFLFEASVDLLPLLLEFVAELSLGSLLLFLQKSQFPQLLTPETHTFNTHFTLI